MRGIVRCGRRLENSDVCGYAQIVLPASSELEAWLYKPMALHPVAAPVVSVRDATQLVEGGSMSDLNALGGVTGTTSDSKLGDALRNFNRK